MTTEQAITEARRRWSTNGMAWILRGNDLVSSHFGTDPFCVGVQQDDKPSFYGAGPTFEAAFTDATNKGH